MLGCFWDGNVEGSPRGLQGPTLRQAIVGIRDEGAEARDRIYGENVGRRSHNGRASARGDRPLLVPVRDPRLL